MDLRDLRKLLDRDALVHILCNIIRQQVGESVSLMLFTLYCMLVTYDDIPQALKWQVKSTIEALERRTPPLTEERRLLAKVLLRSIGVIPRSGISMIPTREAPDMRAVNLYGYTQQQQEPQLTKRQVEELLAACTDTRQLSKDTSKKVVKGYWVGQQYSVQEIAWPLLTQQFSMEPDALQYVVQTLDDDQAILCAAAALLLRKRKELSQDMRREAMQKIMVILGDGERSRRPLDTTEYRVWRLDDVLFETLQVLAE